MWDPPRPGLEPASPALAGRFSTTAPPRKPPKAPSLTHTVTFWVAQGPQTNTDTLPPSRPGRSPELFLGKIKFFTTHLGTSLNFLLPLFPHL